jgi:hypothetical protein
MEKKKTNSIDILKPIKRLSKRFHLILFFVFIVACLSAAVLLINNTLKESETDPNYTSSINAGYIDQATLNRLNDLHTSTQAPPQTPLQPGRSNPVNE